MKNLEKLDELFDIEPIAETNLPLPIEETENATKEEDQEEDNQLARRTLRKLNLKGEDTLNTLVELSKNSETPRHYEVAGQFIKTLSDVSKDLLALQKQAKDLGTEAPKQIGTQNNVVFAGSTNELMKLLGKKHDNIIDQ